MPSKRQHKKGTNLSQTVTRYVWVLFVFSLAGIAVYAGIYYEKNTVIEDVQFSGNYFTKSESLLEAIESPVGLYADSVDYARISTNLKKLPYVNNVNVNMTLRGVLHFRVNEYEPIAMLVDGNRRVYVTVGGIKLPIKPGKARDVPIVYGFPATPANDTLQTIAFKHVEDFLRAAKQNDTGWVTISEITWNEHEGVVALTHEYAVKLVFGQDNFHEKLMHWEAFYTEVVMQKGMNRFSSIDLRFRDQIVTKHS